MSDAINQSALAELFQKLDKATPGPWHYCGSQTCAGVGAPDSEGRTGSFSLVAGQMSFDDSHAVISAINWLRENRATISALAVAAGPETIISTPLAAAKADSD